MDIWDPMMERDAEEVCNLLEQWLRRQVLRDINIFKGEKPTLINWHFESSFQRIGHPVLFFGASGSILCGLLDVVIIGSRRGTRRVFLNARCAFLYNIGAFMRDGTAIRRGIVISIPWQYISRVI
jgi:hypothetical protein